MDVVTLLQQCVAVYCFNCMISMLANCCVWNYCPYVVVIYSMWISFARISVFIFSKSLKPAFFTWTRRKQQRRLCNSKAVLSATMVMRGMRFPWQLRVFGTVSHQPSGMRHHFCHFAAAWRHGFWIDSVTLTLPGCTSFRFVIFTINAIECPCNVIHDSVTINGTSLIIIIVIIIIISLE